tara:strand:- start:662 stop:892 length:231 start_codon:yes stop_codon:yes gene_type:complete
MVSIREIERLIKKSDNTTQWTGEAKEAFSKDMEGVMQLAIDKIESKKNGKNKRISVLDVRDTMFLLTMKMIKGEEE